jgi:filamentous hemagglutinin
MTMAVAVAVDEEGARVVLVSTSEPRGYLRSGVSLDPGDVLVAGLGHAERDAVEYCQRLSLRLLAIGATRPICPECADVIRLMGAEIATPLKAGEAS